MLKKVLVSLALVSCMTGIPASHAELRNDIPSCYQSVNLELPDASSGRELIVVIDGTFDPDIDLKKSVHGKVQRFIHPNDKISVVSFSSYVGSDYTQLRFSGRLEPQIPQGERNAISKKALRQFDNCLGKQLLFARKLIDDAIKGGFKPADVEVPKSEIIANLSRIINPLLAPTAGNMPEKTVLVVSDMLENSDITSFYRAGGVRMIDVSEEINKVKSGNYLTHWHGANVYVIGAGWVHQKYRNSFRGSNVMGALEAFWRSYFELSEAHLVEFGQPVLMRELK